MAGLCAAIAAARGGARTLLVQDRPVLGGNASSEVRMWICGCHGADGKEAGILEEILLENLYRNPGLNYPLWDTVLFEKAKYEDGLELLLNTACFKVHAEDGVISSIDCWQLTSQTTIHIKAGLFIDCSGDSVLRYCGAEFRRGREAKNEYNEANGVEVADAKTMGNSLLLQLRQIDPAQHRPFTPPAWAHVYEEDDLKHRDLKIRYVNNFWWIEFGGIRDTLADAEEIRDELYKCALGVWALIKNHPDGRGHGWELDWLGSLPGKRENIRYLGDHVLTQNCIESEGRFEDIVAHGGWTMDDHPPAAIEFKGEPPKHTKAPVPYGIPYRVLYSRNIENLMFAGRNISATHMALSSTRVMATCATLGQAAGTAAAMAIRLKETPRGIYERHLPELQQRLQQTDQYLPWKAREIPEPFVRAKLTANNEADPEAVRDGWERRQKGEDHHWEGMAGDTLTYEFSEPVELGDVRVVLDSDFTRVKRMPAHYPGKVINEPMPKHLAREFDVEILTEGEDNWICLAHVEENRRRLVTIPCGGTVRAIRLVVVRNWDESRASRVYGFDAEPVTGGKG